MKTVTTRAVYCAGQYIPVKESEVGDQPGQFPASIIHTWEVVPSQFTGEKSIRLQQLMAAAGVQGNAPAGAAFYVEQQCLIVALMVTGTYKKPADEHGVSEESPITAESLRGTDMAVISDLAMQLRAGTATVADLESLKNALPPSGVSTAKTAGTPKVQGAASASG